MVFQYKPGTVIKTPPEVTGAVCMDLTNSGGLTPERLLEASRPEEAPLHGEFEWNDSVAAENYRVSQARYIIRHITIDIEPSEDKEPLQVRAFVNLTQKEHEYRPIRTVIETPEYLDQLLERAKAELTAFKTKYSVISTLAGVFEAIDQLFNGEEDDG